ncbi:hypothetical protein QF025_007080 [Paraburkholderia graminis]|uniref:Uncharacterized protein n=1 Tax=Paraburkholderia graminis TaxID=60548 RepID=A0ABD5CSG4_9BURK|nr:hypothetical protein [Paraburkholderia graminis]
MCAPQRPLSGEAEGCSGVEACLSHEGPYLRRSSAVGMGLCAAQSVSKRIFGALQFFIL